MKYQKLLLLLIVCLLALPGCAILRPFVKDIDGWDLTACASREGFKVCKELFLDNKEKILGGQQAIDLILENMNQRTEIMELETEDGNDE